MRGFPLTLRGTGALALALVCFVCANQLGLVELVYFGMLLLTTIVASFVSLYLVRRTETVSRTLRPDVPTAGRDVAVTVSVAVRSAIPTATGIWRDVVPQGLVGTARGTFPAVGSGLHGGERGVTLHYDVRASDRGIHWMGPLQVTAADPFGLIRRSRSVGDRTRVVVAPTIVDLSPLRDVGGEAGGTLHTTTTQLGQGSDDLIARPYAPGDSMRRIHWRASAHQGDLMVRQEEQESTPEATVVLDRSAPRYSRAATDAAGADDRFEAALSACVSATVRLVHDGYGVTVIDTDGVVLWGPIDGGDGSDAEAMAAAFATLTARDGDSLAHLAALYGGAVTGPLVVIAGVFTEADAAALAPVPHHSALPLLLAASPAGDALGRAAESGWLVAEIGPGIDLSSAWAAASDRGVSDVVR